MSWDSFGGWFLVTYLLTSSVSGVECFDDSWDDVGIEGDGFIDDGALVCVFGIGDLDSEFGEVAGLVGGDFGNFDGAIVSGNLEFVSGFHVSYPFGLDD